MFTSFIGALGSIGTFLVVIVAIWLFFKLLSLPMKIFFKLLWNALIGAAILVVVNIIGGLFSFIIPITILNALIVGLFGTVGVVVLIALKIIGG